MWVKGDNKLSLKNTNEYGINLLQQFFYRSLTKQCKTLIIYGINCEIWPKSLQPPAVYDKKFTDVNQMLDHSHGTYIYLIKRNGSLLLNMHSTIYPMRSMDQDPNFHVSVPSGWAKLGNVFHVHICPMHYLSHYRPFELGSFHVVITNFDYFTFRFFEKSPNCNKFRQNIRRVHNQWKYERLLCTQYWCYKKQIWSETAA